MCCQVLVSIQGMILGVAHPLYNEPGLGGFETGREGEGGSVHVNRPAVRRYDERTQVHHGPASCPMCGVTGLVPCAVHENLVLCAV